MAALAATSAIGPFLDEVVRAMGDHPVMLAPACTLPVDFDPCTIDRWQAAAQPEPPIAFPIAPVLEAAAAEAASDQARTEPAIVARAAIEVPPDGSRKRRLALLQRIEQDLRRALPLDVILQGQDDPAAWTNAVMAVPYRALPTAPVPERLCLLLEPGASAFDAMGLIRALRDRFDARRIELEADLWLAPRDTAQQRAAASLVTQALAGGAPALVIGFGAMAPVAAWLSDCIAAQGHPRPGVLALHVAPPAVRTPRWRRVARSPWTALTIQATARDRSAWVERTARAIGRVAGARTGARLLAAAAHAAMLHGLRGVVGSGEAVRYPEQAMLPRTALYDPVILADLAKAIGA